MGINREEILDRLLERAERATRPSTWIMQILVPALVFTLGLLFGQWLGVWRCHRQALKEGCPGWVVPREGGEKFFRFGPKGE